jgi:hypothetical protein
MSIGAQSIGEAPVAAQADRSVSNRGTPPRKRTIIVQPDRTAQPEAR